MLLLKSVWGGGSGAPLDLGREVLQVLKALRFPDADAAGDPGTSWDACDTWETPGTGGGIMPFFGQRMG